MLQQIYLAGWKHHFGDFESIRTYDPRLSEIKLDNKHSGILAVTPMLQAEKLDDLQTYVKNRKVIHLLGESRKFVVFKDALETLV